MTLQGAGAGLTLLTGGSGFGDRLLHVLTATVQLVGLTLQKGKSGTASGGGLYN